MLSRYSKSHISDKLSKSGRFITEPAKYRISDATEWLKYHEFKHVNETQVVSATFSVLGYGYSGFTYHIFPLYKAINNRNLNLKLVESLLEAGADPNFQTKMTLNPVLHMILMDDNWWNDNTIELLTLLIKYGVNVNSKNGRNKSTCLHQIAILWTNSLAEEIIKLLIENGAKINIRDYNGKTPYDHVLSDSKFYHQDKMELSERILYLLNPSFKNIHNNE